MVFLAGFQVMILAMMAPSSIPLVYLVVYASRRHQYPWMMQGAFLLGYALIWTAFALGAFVADTFLHWLVAIGSGCICIPGSLAQRSLPLREASSLAP